MSLFLFYIFEYKSNNMIDKKSQSIIDSLHPDVRQSATAAMEECDKVLTGRAKVRLTSGQRSVESQASLYELGRTVVNPDGRSSKKPMGNIVTNAKPFQSLHCPFGLAVDFALLVDNKELKWDDIGDFDGDKVADWLEVVQVWERHGWEAGIRWKTFRDAPHLQKSFGYSWQDLKKMYEAGKFISGTKYVDLNRKPIANSSVYRTIASLNLRQGAGTTFPIMKTLLKGEQVREIGRDKGWSKVEASGGYVGFVSNEYLTK